MLEARDAFEISELEPRHAAAALLASEAHGDAVVLEHGDQVLSELRLVAIAITGQKERDLAAGFGGGLRREHARGGSRFEAFARRTRVVFGNRCIGSDAAASSPEACGRLRND